MPRELTPQQIAEKRAKLIQSAVNILEDEGIDALTLRHLAAASDISRSTPYLYFNDKAALLDAMRIHGVHRLVDEYERSIGGHDRYLDQLRLFGETFVDFALNHPELYQLIFVSGLANAGMSEEFCQAVERYRRLTDAPMQLAYDDGVVSLPPERLNPVLWSAIHGMLMLKAAGLAGDDKAFAQLRSDLEQILGIGFIVDGK